MKLILYRYYYGVCVCGGGVVGRDDMKFLDNVITYTVVIALFLYLDELFHPELCACAFVIFNISL